MKIGGKERPIILGLNQTIEYCELNRCSVTKYNEDIQRMAGGDGTGREIRDLVWSALKAGAISKKIDFEHTTYDVGDWIEKLNAADMTEFMQELAASMPRASNDEDKKKEEQLQQ